MMTTEIKMISYLLTVIILWRTHGVRGGKVKQLYDQVTMVEDVVGTYELESMKSLISSSASKLSEAIKQLREDTTDSLGKWQREMETKTDTVQQTANNLKDTLKGTRGYIEDVYKGIKNILQSFMAKSNQKLSDLKLFLEHQSQQFHSVLGITSLASQQILANDCLDLYNLRYNASGTYWLSKFGVRVLCDMETDGGGWLVIQRRAKVSEQVDFLRDWFSYKIGFGNLDTEFWIGNDILHMLTNQRPYEIRIDMQDYENGSFYATYSNFRVGSEKSNYILDIGNYSGNASDAFTYHHGLPFTTYDRDMDNYDEGNCATYFTGGWWYDRYCTYAKCPATHQFKKCYDAHLNGIYPDPPNRDNASYISWYSRNEDMEKFPLVLTNVIIKIRPSIE